MTVATALEIVNVFGLGVELFNLKGFLDLAVLVGNKCVVFIAISVVFRQYSQRVLGSSVLLEPLWSGKGVRLEIVQHYRSGLLTLGDSGAVRVMRIATAGPTVCRRQGIRHAFSPSSFRQPRQTAAEIVDAK